MSAEPTLALEPKLIVPSSLPFTSAILMVLVSEPVDLAVTLTVEAPLASTDTDLYVAAPAPPSASA